jgi:ribose transport system ATP-binding protein
VAVRRLTAQGIGVVYISHHLQEVLRICDQVTVLRDGGVTLSAPAASLTLANVIRAMLGQNLERELGWKSHPRDESAAPLLRIRDLSTAKIRGASFDVRPGEVVGVAGLLGSGRTELLRALFGLDRAEAGTIELAGREVKFTSPQDALRAGIALVPEDRRRLALVPEHTVKANILMAAWTRISRAGFVRDQIGENLAAGFVERLKIRTQGLGQQVARLSGGNQQKVVVAKNLAIRPRVLLLDDPTVGIDVRSKADILDDARALAADGNAILIVSSELAELSALCDRVMILADGRITGWLDRAAGDDLSEEVLTNAIQAGAA